MNAVSTVLSRGKGTEFLNAIIIKTAVTKGELEALAAGIELAHLPSVDLSKALNDSTCLVKPQGSSHRHMEILCGLEKLFKAVLSVPSLQVLRLPHSYTMYKDTIALAEALEARKQSGLSGLKELSGY